MTELAINMFRMRPGVFPEDFARFSAEVDQPTLRALGGVVSRFDVLRVADPTEGSPLGVDIVEIMEVPDWVAWTDVRDHDPALRPVTRGFDALVDPASVRSSLVVPVLKGFSS